VARVLGAFPETESELHSTAQSVPHAEVALWGSEGAVATDEELQQQQEGQGQGQGQGQKQEQQQGAPLCEGVHCLEVSVPMDWDSKTNHANAVPHGETVLWALSCICI